MANSYVVPIPKEKQKLRVLRFVHVCFSSLRAASLNGAAIQAQYTTCTMQYKPEQDRRGRTPGRPVMFTRDRRLIVAPKVHNSKHEFSY